jgi:hypothetical protein
MQKETVCDKRIAMQKHRGILQLATLLAGSLLLTVIAFSAWLYSSQLPDPEHANRRELIRWMVTRDLAKESVRTREALARRLDTEFVDVDWDVLEDRVSAEHCRQLWANLPLLLKPWFMDKIETYYKYDESQREAYVDSIVDRMAQLGGMNRLRKKGTDAPLPKLKELLLANVTIWKKDASPEESQRIGEFFAAIQTRWLMRRLSSDMPSTR